MSDVVKTSEEQSESDQQLIIDEEGEEEIEELGEDGEEEQDEDDVGSSDDEGQIGLQQVNPQIPTHYMERQKWTRLIVILEKANLETCKTARGIELLNCDDHQKVIQKMGRKYEDFRPDVTH